MGSKTPSQELDIGIVLEVISVTFLCDASSFPRTSNDCIKLKIYEVWWKFHKITLKIRFFKNQLFLHISHTFLLLCAKFDPDPILVKTDINFNLRLRERSVHIQVFRLDYKGQTGHTVPIYFLDTDFEEYFKDD